MYISRQFNINSSNFPGKTFQPQSFDQVYSTVCEFPPMKQALTKFNQKAIDYFHNIFAIIIQVGSSCLLGWYCCTQDSQPNENVDNSFSPAACAVASSTMKFPPKFQIDCSKSYDQGMWCLQQQGLIIYFWQITNSSSDCLYSLGALGFSNSVLPLMLALALYFSVYQYFTKTEKCTGMYVQTKMFSWKSTAMQLTGGFHKINLSKCSHRYIIYHICHSLSCTMLKIIYIPQQN